MDDLLSAYRVSTYRKLILATFFFLSLPVEDMVTEVYKDFEVAVQVDPERMKRQSQASSDNSSRELK